MTFAFEPFLGLGVRVTDIWLGQDLESQKKHTWVLFHFPFFSIGIIV